MHLLKSLIIGFVIFQTSCLSQIKELPKLSGNYSVGTILLVFVDSTRYEPFSDNKLEYRELTVKVWYPGEDEADKQYVKYFGLSNKIRGILRLGEEEYNLKTHSKKIKSY